MISLQLVGCSEQVLQIVNKMELICATKAMRAKRVITHRLPAAAPPPKDTAFEYTRISADGYTHWRETEIAIQHLDAWLTRFDTAMASHMVHGSTATIVWKPTPPANLRLKRYIVSKRTPKPKKARAK